MGSGAPLVFDVVAGGFVVQVAAVRVPLAGGIWFARVSPVEGLGRLTGPEELRLQMEAKCSTFTPQVKQLLRIDYGTCRY
jgi:hypothetical protein